MGYLTMVRELGEPNVHFADVDEAETMTIKIGGHPATVVAAPKETLCGESLDGVVVKMDSDQKIDCERCRRVRRRLEWSADEEANTAAVMGWPEQ